MGGLAYDGPFWASASRAVPVALADGAMGLVNALGNLGGFAGPYVGGWLQDSRPEPGGGSGYPISTNSTRMSSVARQLAVFLSYQMEDSPAREDFVSEVTRREPTARFFDYPVTNSFDVHWKERCAELIRGCHGTIVLVGRTTFQSAPVTWEIAETAGHGLPVMGVRLFDEGTTQIPAGLRRAALISRLDVSSVVLRLQAWSARSGDDMS